METLEQSPSSKEDLFAQENPDATPRQETRARWVGTFIVAAFVGGVIGGSVSPLLSGFITPFSFTSQREQQSENMLQNGKNAQIASTDDTTIVGLVDKNSPGVVSIVISKDVSRVRGMFGSPFFFNPFHAPNQNDGSEQGTSEKKQVGSGSGFFVSSDGLIITNKHVVSDEQADYTVIVSGSDKEYPAKVLARDPNNDIAVLKIDGDSFPALTLGDSDAVKVGQTVLAIGNPLGEFANSVSRGIISGLKRSVNAGSSFGDTEKLTGIIQTDAAINPGNSGGPLFNISGEVIGINVATAQGAENIGFALPINSVKRVVNQVVTTGKITTPYLGIRYILLNDVLKKQNNLDFNYGALVLRGQTITDFAVIPGSPADKAGIMENDIILEIAGTKIDDEHPLGNILGQYNVGDEILLKVWHKGETKDVKLTLEERK